MTAALERPVWNALITRHAVFSVGGDHARRFAPDIGPPRTPALGEFWGIKDAGVLVAMAGERMKHEGFTEVSGVCTHPHARGRGLGRALSAHVAARISARGDTPYLHAYASNTAAIELYRSLGFAIHRQMYVAAISS
jgi:predicted GNAT family acetyltransferase